MDKLKLLIVEGNTKEENLNFNNAGCVPQSENFEQHIKSLEPNSEIDIVEPVNDNSISKIISSLKKYDGIVLTGSTLRIEDTSDEVKKHIEFVKTCFKHDKRIFAACWGLQITVTAAGGKCRVAPRGAHVGIAYDIELTNEGKKHKLYSSKPHKFTTPAFNYDEVETPPNNAKIWGLQYHPEIPYDYMIKLIKHRSQGLIDKNVFKNQNEINQHIKSIEHAKAELKDDMRIQELKNWLDYLKR